MAARVLFLADTHLGFDLPMRPRIRRRRRGYDFLANYERALAKARDAAVDLVVHGGDVFHRPGVPHTLVHQAFEPLKRLADSGVPVFVVPGNHERSRIPHARFAQHPGVHVFDVPRTVAIDLGGLRIAVAGFPFERGDVRSRFRALVEATGLGAHDADVTLLCAHHCFEGATVGPADYTFRSTPDTIRGSDVPAGIAAVLTGHVHRHQVLTEDLAGRPLAAPVLYPGSVERTAFAEKGEAKGYLLVELEADDGRVGGRLSGWRFEELPARPMIERDLRVDGLGSGGVEHLVREALEEAPVDAVLRLRVRGPLRPSARLALAAKRLRALAPSEMNLEVVLADQRRGRRGRRGKRVPAGRDKRSVDSGAAPALGLGSSRRLVGRQS